MFVVFPSTCIRIERKRNCAKESMCVVECPTVDLVITNLERLREFFLANSEMDKFTQINILQYFAVY